MTGKDAFTDEEWVRVRRAPTVAGMAISLADPGGPIELSKETMATLRGIGSPPTQDELLLAVSQEIMAMGQRRENPMSGFKVEDPSKAGEQVLDELGEVQAIVGAKATPEEAAAFARWLVEVAQEGAQIPEWRQIADDSRSPKLDTPAFLSGCGCLRLDRGQASRGQTSPLASPAGARGLDP